MPADHRFSFGLWTVGTYEIQIAGGIASQPIMIAITLML